MSVRAVHRFVVVDWPVQMRRVIWRIQELERRKIKGKTGKKRLKRKEKVGIRTLR